MKIRGISGRQNLLDSYFYIDCCGFVDYAGLQRPFSYQFKNHGHNYPDFNSGSYNDN